MFTHAKMLIMMGGSVEYTNLFSLGECETITGWTKNSAVTIATDSDNEYAGTNCIKITLNAGQAVGGAYKDVTSIIDKAKYYLISAYLKNANVTNGIRIQCVCTGDVGAINSDYNVTTDYVRKGVITQPTDYDGATAISVYAQVIGAETQYGYFDNYMINEITAADYAAGLAACLTKYPYKAPV